MLSIHAKAREEFQVSFSIICHLIPLQLCSYTEPELETSGPSTHSTGVLAVTPYVGAGDHTQVCAGSTLPL